MQYYKVDNHIATIQLSLMTAALSVFQSLKSQCSDLKTDERCQNQSGFVLFLLQFVLFISNACMPLIPKGGVGGDFPSPSNTACLVFPFSWQSFKSFFLHTHQDVPVYLQFLALILFSVWQLFFYFGASCIKLHLSDILVLTRVTIHVVNICQAIKSQCYKMFICCYAISIHLNSRSRQANINDILIRTFRVDSCLCFGYR